MLINYIYMHRSFLLSKLFVLILLILLMVLHINTLYASQLLEGFQYIDGFKVSFAHDYFNEVFLVSEYVLVFSGIFIGLVLANQSNQALTMYSVFSKATKTKFYMSRLICGLIMIIVICFINGLMIYIVTSRFTPYMFSMSIYVKHTIYLMLEVYQYFLVTLIFMGIINHFLMGLLSLIIFWLYEILYPSMSIRSLNISSYIFININDYGIIEKKIEIFVILYIFLTISYIIFMVRKDC